MAVLMIELRSKPDKERGSIISTAIVAALHGRVRLRG